MTNRRRRDLAPRTPSTGPAVKTNASVPVPPVADVPLPPPPNAKGAGPATREWLGKNLFALLAFGLSIFTLCHSADLEKKQDVKDKRQLMRDQATDEKEAERRNLVNLDAYTLGWRVAELDTAHRQYPGRTYGQNYTQRRAMINAEAGVSSMADRLHVTVEPVLSVAGHPEMVKGFFSAFGEQYRRLQEDVGSVDGQQAATALHLGYALGNQYYIAVEGQDVAPQIYKRYHGVAVVYSPSKIVVLPNGRYLVSIPKEDFINTGLASLGLKQRVAWDEKPFFKSGDPLPKIAGSPPGISFHTDAQVRLADGTQVNDFRLIMGQEAAPYFQKLSEDIKASWITQQSIAPTN